jgi:hypothetical protein
MRFWQANAQEQRLLLAFPSVAPDGVTWFVVAGTQGSIDCLFEMAVNQLLKESLYFLLNLLYSVHKAPPLWSLL